jgi:hypothetical protein
MAIRVATQGLTDLRLATAIGKANFTASRSIAGVPGVRGQWQAYFVRLPSSGMAVNQLFVMAGFDQGGAGNFNFGGDHRLRIGGDSAGSNVASGAMRLRPWPIRVAASYTQPFDFSGASGSLPQMTTGGTTAWLVIEGIVNTGTDASPVWRGFSAVCPVGGSVSSHSFTTVNATYLSATTGTILGQIFAAAGTGANRTAANTVLEHYALVQGDFPWDTVNDRPHHDVIRALAAGSGASTLYTYDSLQTAQNAGTLPFANLRQGRSDVTHWYKLESLTDLANAGSGGANALTVTNWNSGSGGLVNEASIVPAHWITSVAPTITAPRCRLYGGRGARALTFSGTYVAGVTTALERRFVLRGTTTPVAGFDWADIAGISGGTWSITATLPPGNFDLVVRDKNAPAQSATLEDILVGTMILTHGQSGMELAWQGSGQPEGGTNNLNITVASGAQGAVITLANQYAGTSGSYSKPAMLERRMVSGQTPANVGQGAVLALNQWNLHNPGHPLMIVNMAINGTGMSGWAANDTILAQTGQGHASWTMLGAVQEPGVSNAAGSGIVGFYAWHLNQYVDAHILQWHPGIATDEATRDAYVAAVDARFSQNATAPWLLLQPWRGATYSYAHVVNLKELHVQMVARLGERGFLGPHWTDIINDGKAQHAAYNSAPGVPDATNSVSDGNHVGQARLGRSMGWAIARIWNQEISTQFRILAAWWTDAAVRDQIQIDLGRPARTLNGAAVRSDVCWISTDAGTTWANTGFTAALDSTATRLVLTRTGGGSWPAGTTRVDYARDWVDSPLAENTVEPLLDGLLYDGFTYRGRVNLATPAGNSLSGTNRGDGSNAGLPVQARGAPRLLAFERMTGARSVTVRMLAADGVTVLREKSISITTS